MKIIARIVGNYFVLSAGYQFCRNPIIVQAVVKICLTDAQVATIK
jgi:hypothetical protein